MTAPEQLDALDAKLASQIGDDVSVIFNHEYLFKHAREAITALRAESARLTAERDAALAGRVKVKPLVWEALSNGSYTAHTAFGEYSVGFDDGWWCELSGPVYWNWEAPEDPRSYYGPYAAKAAAQADYEARSRAPLEPQPITVQDAARVLLDSLHSTPRRGVSQVWAKAYGSMKAPKTSLGDLDAALRAIAEQEGQ